MDDKPKRRKTQYYYAVHIPYSDTFSNAVAYKFSSKAARDSYIENRTRNYSHWFACSLDYIKQNNIPLARIVIKY